MGKAHETLAAIFAEPTRANIAWRDIESLFKSYGAQVTRGRGSRVRVVFDIESQVVRATFHRPHPRNEAHRPLVRSVRRLLEEVGITP